MSRMRMLIVAFWVFIASMLLWQFYNYNEGLKQSAIDHPRQEHFWFTNSVATVPVAPSSGHRDGPDVQQTGFSIENNTPATGSITCHVTLKNEGNAKAVGIQVMVRPFRGASNYDEDAGHQDSNVVLSDDDPISKFGQYVTFPDLAPGESSTQSVVFIGRSFMVPGKNPNPEILFQAEKAPPQAPHKSASD